MRWHNRQRPRILKGQVRHKCQSHLRLPMRPSPTVQCRRQIGGYLSAAAEKHDLFQRLIGSDGSGDRPLKRVKQPEIPAAQYAPSRRCQRHGHHGDTTENAALRLTLGGQFYEGCFDVLLAGNPRGSGPATLIDQQETVAAAVCPKLRPRQPISKNGPAGLDDVAAGLFPGNLRFRAKSMDRFFRTPLSS